MRSVRWLVLALSLAGCPTPPDDVGAGPGGPGAGGPGGPGGGGPGGGGPGQNGPGAGGPGAGGAGAGGPGQNGPGGAPPEGGANGPGGAPPEGGENIGPPGAPPEGGENLGPPGAPPEGDGAGGAPPAGGGGGPAAGGEGAPPAGGGVPVDPAERLDKTNAVMNAAFTMAGGDQVTITMNLAGGVSQQVGPFPGPCEEGTEAGSLYFLTCDDGLKVHIKPEGGKITVSKAAEGGAWEMVWTEPDGEPKAQ